MLFGVWNGDVVDGKKERERERNRLYVRINYICAESIRGVVLVKKEKKTRERMRKTTTRSKGEMRGPIVDVDRYIFSISFWY